MSPRGPELLRRFLEANGLTCGAIAERLDPRVESQTVFRWANGTRRPSEAYLSQIESLTGVPADSWRTEREIARERWLKNHPKAGD